MKLKLKIILSLAVFLVPIFLIATSRKSVSIFPTDLKDAPRDATAIDQLSGSGIDNGAASGALKAMPQAPATGVSGAGQNDVPPPGTLPAAFKDVFNGDYLAKKGPYYLLEKVFENAKIVPPSDVMGWKVGRMFNMAGDPAFLAGFPSEHEVLSIGRLNNGLAEESLCVAGLNSDYCMTNANNYLLVAGRLPAVGTEFNPINQCSQVNSEVSDYQSNDEIVKRFGMYAGYLVMGVRHYRTHMRCITQTDAGISDYPTCSDIVDSAPDGGYWMQYAYFYKDVTPNTRAK